MQCCSLCGFPDTRPGLIFEGGICGACINYAKRKDIDWGLRQRELAAICDKYRGSKPYDCLIPVSGGKDSHSILWEMKKNNMHPILFTVSDWFTQTRAGKHNLENLAQRHDLISMRMSRDLFVRATRWAFEQTGEALKYIENLIYLWPIQYAQRMKIPIVLFGEDPNFQYGTSMVENAYANLQIGKMIKKFSDEWKFWKDAGISRLEIESSLPLLPLVNPMVLWMSYFRPWSSVDNLEVARANGFKTLDDFRKPDGTREWERKGSFEFFEQIDSIGYWTHLQMKILKFGFGRTTDLACRRLREGLISREECDVLITEHDHVFDTQSIEDFCKVMDYSEKEFWEIANRHRIPDAI